MLYIGTLHDKPNRDIGWINEFKKIGWKVIEFSNDYEVHKFDLIARIFKRFHIGPKQNLLENKILELVELENPDCIHFRLPINISSKTILKIKNQNRVVSQYFNDDPFSKKSKLFYFNKFKKAIPFYDINFVYRKSNIDQFLKHKAKLVYHCKPTYDPSRHYVSQIVENRSFIADAAFIGHYENDNRLPFLNILFKKKFKLILKGGMWNKAIKKFEISNLGSINHAFGEEYNFIYSNVIAGLCFFSKINNDSWTERPLEIIAVGGVLVCERTQEAETYFKDREEAMFFSDINELIEILNILKHNLIYREFIRINGHNKLMNSKNSITDRALEMHNLITKNFQLNEKS